MGRIVTSDMERLLHNMGFTGIKQGMRIDFGVDHTTDKIAYLTGVSQNGKRSVEYKDGMVTAKTSVTDKELGDYRFTGQIVEMQFQDGGSRTYYDEFFVDSSGNERRGIAEYDRDGNLVLTEQKSGSQINDLEEEELHNKNVSLMIGNQEVRLSGVNIFKKGKVGRTEVTIDPNSQEGRAVLQAMEKALREGTVHGKTAEVLRGMVNRMKQGERVSLIAEGEYDSSTETLNMSTLTIKHGTEALHYDRGQRDWSSRINRL